MKNKQNFRCVYLYADWDRGYTKKNDAFYDEVRKFNNVFYEVLNVEDSDGLNVSIKYSIRNVPALLLFNNNKLIAVEKGNHCHEQLGKYLK